MVGTSEPPSLALLALSGAITPLTSPFPNVLSASLTDLAAYPYANQSTTAEPSPGIAPIIAPSDPHLATSHQFSSTSLKPLTIPSLSAYLLVSAIAVRRAATSHISGNANKPSATGSSGRSSIKYNVSSVQRSWPLVGSPPTIDNRIPKPAIDKPRKGIEPESADTIDNPKIEKASNSGELMFIRIGRSTGMVKPRRKAPHNPPINEAA